LSPLPSFYLNFVAVTDGTAHRGMTPSTRGARSRGACGRVGRGGLAGPHDTDWRSLGPDPKLRSIDEGNSFGSSDQASVSMTTTTARTEVDDGFIHKGEFPWAPNSRCRADTYDESIEEGDGILLPSHLDDTVLTHTLVKDLHFNEEEALTASNRSLKKNIALVKKFGEGQDEIAELKRELGQCRKCEDAISAVLVWRSENKQDITRSRLAFEDKKLEIQRKEAALAKERFQFERETIEFENEKALFKNEKAKFENEKAKFENEKKNEEKMRTTKEQLAAENQSLAEQKKELEKIRPIIPKNPLVLLEPRKRWVFYFGRAKAQFNVEPNPAAAAYDPLPSIDMKDKDIMMMRTFDYYKGWLDCMKAVEDTEAERDGATIPTGMSDYLSDNKDPRNPYNAGQMIGANFGWSTICKEHQESGWDIRLDNRQWQQSELMLFQRFRAHHAQFWAGLSDGYLFAMRLFIKECKKTDAEQILV
jgi:hypothetical protein